MLRWFGSTPLPDPTVVRTRLMALAGMSAPTQPAAEPEDVAPAPRPEPAAGAGAGRALVVIAVVAVLLAGWLTWRAQGGAVSASVVSAGAPFAGAPSPSIAVPPASAEPEVVVQVVGTVRRPGLVRLPAGARVGDAIAAAGGLRSGRSAGLLNLARRVVDGEQIAVGVTAPATPPASGAAGQGPAGSPQPGRLDLNAADQTALETLPGVGPVTAQAILLWRSEHGRFATVDQLREVDGIGPKTYDRLAPLVQVDGRP